ncbi:hypothetical protein F5Y17DRAFT_340512 [Xylariaceae sp. FL0594]|nr:hypothetical protein F5Y17DRAFT_340512 [Xylariaceae sp. FL0594]
MCFTSSDRTDDPPPRPVHFPQQQQSIRNSSSRPTPAPKSNMPQSNFPQPHPSRHAQANMDSAYDVPPPPGPPPSQHHQQERQQQIAPPSGPPPAYSQLNNPFLNSSSQQGQSSGFPEPRRGALTPQPTKQHALEDEFQATPSVPPPDFASVATGAASNNAPPDQAQRAKDFCHRYQLWPPRPVNTTNVTLLYDTELEKRKRLWTTPVGEARNRGGFRIYSTSGPNDHACLVLEPPLYSALSHGPTKTGNPKTIYYEVHVATGRPPTASGEITLALGYVAMPYPNFRAPGWNRGSLGVHGDDGRRFVNDDEDGLIFTNRFFPGEKLGLGMRFRPAGAARIDVEVFFTRNGVEERGWDLHEAKDMNKIGPEGVLGLAGWHDLNAAVACWEVIDFELVYAPHRWAWQGWRREPGFGFS